MTDGGMTAEQREEAFREFHANHLRRQTAALETVRTILVVWAVLTVLGALVLIVKISQGPY